MGCYKYLGILFTRTLSWSQHVQNACAQANKILVAVLKSLYRFKPIPYNLFFKIFDTKISPILLYGCEIWGVDVVNSIESVHMRACKRFLCVKTCTPNHVVRGECARYPLYITTLVHVVKYWCRIIKMPNSKNVRKCYNMLLQQSENGKLNWVTRVKLLLEKTGFSYIWLQQDVSYVKLFLSEFKYRLRASYEQDWHSALLSSSKNPYVYIV